MGPVRVRMVRHAGCPGWEGVFGVTHETLPDLGVGEIRMRIDDVAIDPGMRGWMTDKRRSMPPVRPGEVMRAWRGLRASLTRSPAWSPMRSLPISALSQRSPAPPRRTAPD